MICLLRKNRKSRLLAITAALCWLGTLPYQVTAAVAEKTALPHKPDLAKSAIRTIRQPAVKPIAFSLSSATNVSHVVVKFSEYIQVRLSSGKLISPGRPLVRGLKNALERYQGYGQGPSLRRLFVSKNEETYSRRREINQTVTKTQLADLNNYYLLNITDPVEARNLVNELNGYSQVEIAYVAPVPEVAGDISPPTPDYSTSQSYLRVAPGGIDADFAHTQPGGDGAGVRIIDIEIGWHETHEDLDAAASAFVLLDNSTIDANHGTAVIGALIGGDNGYGVTGVSPGAEIGMISVSTRTTAEAILLAGDYLSAGDIVLIELHAPGPHFDFQSQENQAGYVCMEYFQAEFDAIQYLWAQGIIVVEAAGNGGEDYDDIAIYGQVFDTTYRNSHAIIVGAGAPPSGFFGVDRSRLSFSCYGERVNLQGYGQEVVTTGYGDLFNPGGDVNQRYTATFSGTSSASPIVAGSVASVQGAFLATYSIAVAGDVIRDLLVSTGSVQAGDLSTHIGPRPDLSAALTALSAPPSLYTEPTYLDTTLAQGESANFSLWLFNRATSTTLDFSVIGQDALARQATPDWLQVAPGSGSIAPLDSVELTVTLDATALDDQVGAHKGLIDVSWGPSGGALDSTTVAPVFVTVPCGDTTYYALSSDSASGPEFVWEDLSLSGTKIPSGNYYNTGSAALDDGTAGPFTLPFDFPFFGQTYRKVWVGVNGAISFSDTAVNVNGYFASQTIPGAAIDGLASAFWNDLTIDPDGGGNGDIYFASLPGIRWGVQWNHVGNFNSAEDTLVSFQIILQNNGDIIMRYLNVGETNLAGAALIGLQDFDCSYTPYLDQGAPLSLVVTDSSAVRFSYTPLVLEQAGDANRSGSINIADAIFLINMIFNSGPELELYAAGDANCSDVVNIADAIFLINMIFNNGPESCFFEI